MDEMMTRIRTVFQDVFDDPQLVVTAASTAGAVPGWDSLTNINLVFAIEREFKVKFALGEIQELNDVGQMAALIRKKRSA